MNPPATIPRPETSVLTEFATFVEVVRSRTQHTVRIRWTWDGESEVSAVEDFTVGDTQQKALETAIAMMEANERHPERGEPPDGTVTDGRNGVDVFTITDPDGEVVLELEPGDAIEVEFFNTFSKDTDTTQGVIERIRAAAEADETLIFLSNDVTVRPARGGAVRIEDRRRGHLPRDQPVPESIRQLFDAGAVDDGGQATLGGDMVELSRAEQLLRMVRQKQQEIPPPMGARRKFAAVSDAMVDVAKQIAAEPPSPFADELDELVAELETFLSSATNWFVNNVSGTFPGRERRLNFEAIIDAIQRNKPKAREEALEFVAKFAETPGAAEEGAIDVLESVLSHEQGRRATANLLEGADPAVVPLPEAAANRVERAIEVLGEADVRRRLEAAEPEG